VAVLRRADYQRGLERIRDLPQSERQPTIDKTYSLRGDAASKLHLVSLLSDQDQDRDLVEDARALIEMCDDLSDQSVSEDDLANRNVRAKDATRTLIEKAGQRMQDHA
jgi:hypothetical protein